MTRQRFFASILALVASGLMRKKRQPPITWVATDYPQEKLKSANTMDDDCFMYLNAEGKERNQAN